MAHPPLPVKTINIKTAQRGLFVAINCAVDPQCAVDIFTEEALINGLTFPRNLTNVGTITYRSHALDGCWGTVLIGNTTASARHAIFATHLPILTLLYPLGDIHAIMNPVFAASC